MTDHPITPPPELVEQWHVEAMKGHRATGIYGQDIATQAARWGADQELEECCEWLNKQRWPALAIHLRDARRPKPPSLKEQALGLLNEGPVSDLLDHEVDTIRRALNELPDN
jgi:hypothetical protein